MSGAPLESFRDEELLADVICRLIGQDVRHIAVGAQSPIPATAALLARERNLSVRAGLMCRSSAAAAHTFFTDGARELFDCAGQGRVDVFFLSGGQIDGQGNINLVSVGDYEHPEGALPRLVRLRLPLLCRAQGDPVPHRALAPHAGAEGRFRQRAGRQRRQCLSPRRPDRARHQPLPVRFRPRARALSPRERASGTQRRRGDREYRLRFRPAGGCAGDAGAVGRDACT